MAWKGHEAAVAAARCCGVKHRPPPTPVAAPRMTAGAVVLAVLLARYPHLFAWQSPCGIVYLIFLDAFLLTGVAGLAQGLSRPAAGSPPRFAWSPAGEGYRWCWMSPPGTSTTA